MSGREERFRLQGEGDLLEQMCNSNNDNVTEEILKNLNELSSPEKLNKIEEECNDFMNEEQNYFDDFQIDDVPEIQNTSCDLFCPDISKIQYESVADSNLSRDTKMILFRNKIDYLPSGVIGEIYYSENQVSYIQRSIIDVYNQSSLNEVVLNGDMFELNKYFLSEKITMRGYTNHISDIEIVINSNGLRCKEIIIDFPNIPAVHKINLLSGIKEYIDDHCNIYIMS